MINCKCHFLKDSYICLSASRGGTSSWHRFRAKIPCLIQNRIWDPERFQAGPRRLGSLRRPLRGNSTRAFCDQFFSLAASHGEGNTRCLMFGCKRFIAPKAPYTVFGTAFGFVKTDGFWLLRRCLSLNNCSLIICTEVSFRFLDIVELIC